MNPTDTHAMRAAGDAVAGDVDSPPDEWREVAGQEGMANTLAILAPSGADATIATRVLAKWGIASIACATMDELCAVIDRAVGAALIAEEALRSSERERLLRALDRQPTWSDVPLIVLTGEGELGHVVASGVGDVAGRGNVTLLERPVRVATLTLAVRAALRARQRQYQLRDQLIERERLVAAERRARAHAVRLQELTASLSVASTSAEVIAASVEHAARASGAIGAVVAWVQDDGMVEILGASDMARDDRAEWQRFPLDAPVPLATVSRTGEPMFLESPLVWEARFPAMAPLAAAAGHRANAVLPLVVEGRSVGALGLAFAQPQTFPVDDRLLVLSIARQCALALARAQLYESERRARNEADQANRAKMDFLAVMSHELRTPLNAIAGYAELLDMELYGPVTAEQHEALTRVGRSERHLRGLINAVLNFARVEMGSVQFDMDDVAVDDVLSMCETLVAPQAREKGLRLDVPAPDPSLVVRADREKVQQIVLNLLSNAIKFTASGGRVSVSHEVVNDESDAEVIAISVSDTGRGIPGEKIESIFEPFMQVDVALTRTSEGVGLGLAISRDLARAMQGDLRAASVVGQGTTLTLTLPRA